MKLRPGGSTTKSPTSKSSSPFEAQNLELERLELQETEKRIAAMEGAIPAWEAKVLSINERLSKNLQYKNNVLREQGFYDHMLGTLGNVDLNKNVQQEQLRPPATGVSPPAGKTLPPGSDCAGGGDRVDAQSRDCFHLATAG